MKDNLVRPLLQSPRAAIMGIINTTPDSFSDGGLFNTTQAAVEHGLRLADEGAQILDIGGESTRPGATKVEEQEELDRVIPVIQRLVQRTEVPISIDTYKPTVMREAVNAGAQMINDINGLRAESAVKTAAELRVPVCLMHMQGSPQNMQLSPCYEDVIADVVGFFKQRISECEVAGIPNEDVVLDPGIGFGKNLEHNLLLLKHLPLQIVETGCQVLIGVSRKSLIDKQLGRSVEERLPASLGLAVQAALAGAKIIRVHDVRATLDAVRMAEAVRDVI